MPHRIKFSFAILLGCTLISILGCIASSKNVFFITQDQVGAKQGLFLLRVRIKDNSGALKHGAPPDLVVQKQVERRQDDDIRIFLKSPKGASQYLWREEDGADYFDQYYYLSAMPGRYFLKYLSIQVGAANEMVYKGTQTNYFYLNVPLYACADLTGDDMVPFGTLNIEVNSKNANESALKTTYSYTMRFDESSEQTATIIDDFKNKFPSLWGKYSARQEIGRPFFGFYSNFSKYLDASNKKGIRWHKHYSNTGHIYRDSSSFSLEGKHSDKTLFAYATMKDPLSLPSTYQVHYQMRWIEGMMDATYGFLIKQDEKNSYFFCATAAGMPDVWVKKDGQWLSGIKIDPPSRFLHSSKEPDDFKIERKDGTFTYRINDEVVTKFKDIIGITDNKIGFFVSGTQKAAVDFITITEK